jgi:hypothetical protein
VARREWPSDRGIVPVIKATTLPADTQTPTWAAVFGHVQNLDVVSLLAPGSAAVKFLARCLSFEWGGCATLNLPTMAPNASAMAWQAEGQPGPVHDFVTSGVSITPRKILSTCVFSREMAEYSTPSFEMLVRLALSESLSLALDSTLFSAAAGTAVKPPGLFAGVVPLTASASSVASEAMTEDASRLISAVSAISMDNPILLVMAPRQAVAMKLRADIGQFEVYSSPAMADGSVAAVASNALVSVGDAQPQFRASHEASLHMEDSTPMPLGTASPTRTPFQTDCLVLRLSQSLNWGLRDARGVALIQNCVW